MNQPRIVLLLFALLPFFSDAQEISHIVQMKDGSSFRGKIISPESSLELSILLNSGDTVTVNRNYVASKVQDQKKYHFFPNGTFTPTSGKYFSIIFNLYPGTFENEWSQEPRFGLSPISFSAGWRFSQQLETGIGIGLDFLDELYLPLYAEARFFLNKKAFAPFVGGKIGGSFLIVDSDQFFNPNSNGGLMLNPLIGFKISTKRSSKFLFETGVRIQKAKFTWGSTVDHFTYNRYSLGMGMVF